MPALPSSAPRAELMLAFDCDTSTSNAGAVPFITDTLAPGGRQQLQLDRRRHRRCEHIAV